MPVFLYQNVLMKNKKRNRMKKKKVYSKAVIGCLMSVSLLTGGALSSVALADIPLPPQDSLVTTIIDKSVIHGSLAHDGSGNLLYDNAGNARFQYSGKIYSVETNSRTGELKEMENKIGSITGEAAFPPDFVALSAGVNALMQSMQDGSWDGTMPKMPSVVPWTCNHCYMTAGGTTYVSIVDVLDPDSPYYSEELANKFDEGLIDGAEGAFDSMRMKGRAFTGLTPASFDPVTRTMSVRMAGCSALVAIAGPLAGKVGTLCMNATATFDVRDAIATFDFNTSPPTQTGYEPTSAISADGSSNCITVMHTPTM
jgi:hypothetical protein